SGLPLGDTVLWGGAANSAAGMGEAFRGDAMVPYVFGVGEDVAYALVKDGDAFPSSNGPSWIIVALVRGASLPPGKGMKYERAFLVAPRGDTAAVATELFFLRGGSPGGVELGLAWESEGSLRAHRDRI